ncbi:hypothetical protein NMY22_g11960 [Coprinellus aureogranulatus]|nr:hypothetical protein NMY22_g11960 [Coprinellus aureogranulatus]
MSPSSSTHYVQEAVFNHVEGNYNDHRRILNVSRGGSKDPSILERLERHVSKGAAHDSSERARRAEMRPGNEDCGPAGAGKTAIMGSIADACYASGWLAASFFFSAFVPSSPDRRSKACLIPTLAYHLMHYTTIPRLRDRILAAVEHNPFVFDKNLDQQLDILILQPLGRVGYRAKSRNGTFNTEQERRRSRENNHKEILAVLARASQDPSFPFRIVIASRPERTFQQFFSTRPGLATEMFLGDKYDPDSDIARYLNSKFNAIRRKFGLPMSWGSEEEIRQLVMNASGQFIYAATIVRYIEDDTKRTPPLERLKQVLKWKQYNTGSQPLAPLDALYRGILETSPDTTLAVQWLRFIDVASEWSDRSNRYGVARYHWFPRHTKQLLESYSGEMEFVLGGLASLVGLVDRDGETQFTFYHKSFLDFLTSPERSGSLYLSDESITTCIQDRFYAVLKNRGPQGTPSDGSQADLIFPFSERLSFHIDPKRLYQADDAEWWLGCMENMIMESCCQLMFVKVHCQVCDLNDLLFTASMF